MTALSEYDRLESTGLWRENPDAQRREVIVSFGNETVVISDHNDNALAHWALPAIKRLNPKQTPPTYSPDAQADETLELEDEIMIEALEKVLGWIEKKRPKQGRLRWFLLTVFVAIVAALAIFWLPDALVRHTTSVVPQAKRLHIGNALLANIYRISGQPCTSTAGNNALNKLGIRITGDVNTKLVILPAGVIKSSHLPGGFILLNRALVEDFEEPDVVAGFILGEKIRKINHDPLDTLLRSIGLRNTFTFLTTGKISNDILARYAQELLTTPSENLGTEEFLQGFQSAKLRSSPYAFAQDPTGETTLELIEADPFMNSAPPALISDGEWVSLQRICEK